MRSELLLWDILPVWLRKDHYCGSLSTNYQMLPKCLLFRLENVLTPVCALYYVLPNSWKHGNATYIYFTKVKFSSPFQRAPCSDQLSPSVMSESLLLTVSGDFSCFRVKIADSVKLCTSHRTGCESNAVRSALTKAHLRRTVVKGCFWLQMPFLFSGLLLAGACLVHQG